MARKKRSLYEVLGIAPGSSLAEIRAAHRERVKARHPDRGGSAEDFAETTHAWVVLRDTARRAEYDRTGEDPGEAVDQHESLLMGVLAHTINTMLQQPLESILAANVVLTLREFLREEIAAAQKQIDERQKLRAKIARVAKRFRKKSAGADTVASIFRGQLSQLDLADANAKAQMALREEVRELLSDYEFDQELPMWIGAPSGGGGGGGYALGSLGKIFGQGFGL